MDKPTDQDERGNGTPPVPPSLEGEHIIELGNNVDFSNFQVVRGEYYADIRLTRSRSVAETERTMYSTGNIR